MIELYKDGNTMALRTDCGNEEAFTRQFSELLGSMIDSAEFENDWEFQLNRWLPAFVEICCQLRGYKADVDKHTVLTAGDRVVVADGPRWSIDDKLQMRGLPQPVELVNGIPEKRVS